MSADNSQHQYTGQFFEEFVQLLPDGTAKGLGVRIVEKQEGRLLGVAGAKHFILNHHVILLRCFKEVKIRATNKNKMHIMTTLQRIEGRK